MHELTLLFGVADKVGKVAKENGIDHVDAVVLEVGEATLVVPEYLMDGWPVISDEFDVIRGAELIVERVTAVGRCRECGTEYEIVRNEGRCPSCGSRDKDVVQGTEFIIKEVRLLEPAEGSAEAPEDGSADEN